MKQSAKVTVVLAALFAASAQQSVPRGTATDIGNAEIQATVRKTAQLAVSDRQLGVLGVSGDYNVGIGVVHRAKTNGPQTANGVET
jgi:hypothetical protein